MPKAPKPLAFGWFFLFAALFALQVVPRFWSDSLTTDEPLKIADCFYYGARGDVLSNIHQAPFATALEPSPIFLLPLKPNPSPSPDSSNRAFQFLYVTNRDHLEAITVLSRIVPLALGLGIGFLLFGIGRRRSPIFAFSTLALWAFEPNLLAYSGIAISDIQVTFFFLASILAFLRSSGTGGWKWPLATGLLTAMAVLSKYSALVLIPIFALLEFLEHRKTRGPFPWSALAKRWLPGALGFLAFIFIFYLPATLQLPGHLSPFGYFLSALDQIILHGESPWPSYFLGRLSHERYWAYYPVTFFLKAPLPLSLFLGTALFLFLRKDLSIPRWQWVPALLFLLAILRAIDLGVRYLLPLFPFVILMAAAGAEWLWKLKTKPLGRGPQWLTLGLLAWQALSVLSQFPHHLSYFNDLISSEEKLHLLGDSNLDFDQDLKRLAQTGNKRGWPDVKLAYSGGTPLDIYGLKWERWTEKDLAGPQPGNVYAVNAGFLQVAPAFFPQILPIAQGWITRVPPTGKVADTWYYFEVPGERRKDNSPIIDSIPVFRGSPGR